MTMPDTFSTPELPERYLPISELGRGGMGVVWRVQDRQFDRPLAVKMMLPGSAGNAEAVARFEREAALTGSLQHPAIPPVVDRGTLEGGEPYFSLKLVKGETLAELLTQRASVEDNLPHFLGIFEQICQAVGYAHSRGIIHRDLKPSNVMVGAFGEVQVMDWGMAKQISESEQSPSRSGLVETSEFSTGTDPLDDGEATVEFNAGMASTAFLENKSKTHQLEESHTLTRGGQVMGTLAYMPPEQARGDTRRLDARADVFALGGILCKILTDSAVYSESDVNRLYQRVLAADLTQAEAALQKCRADAELIGLCRRCLNREPDQRPADASIVAADIRRYEESTRHRLEQERIERAEAEAKAGEEKKRRRMTLFAAALAVLLLSGLAGAGGWYQQEQTRAAARIAREQSDEQHREQLARSDVASAIREVPRLRARYQYDAAIALAEQAASRVQALRDPGDLADEIATLLRDIRMIRQLDRIRLERIALSGDSSYRKFATGPDGDYDKCFREYGLDILNSPPKATGAEIRKSKIAAELIDGLYEWSQEETADNQRVIVDTADFSEANEIHSRLRGKKLWEDPPELKRVLDQLDFGSLSTTFTGNIARTAIRFGRPQLAFELTKRILNDRPDDFWVHMFLGSIRGVPGIREEDRVGHYRAALAIRPQTAAAHNNLGVELKKQKRYSEAAEALHKAIQLESHLSLAHNNLGTVFNELKQFKAAETAFRKAIELDPTADEPWTNLGNVFSNHRQFVQAETAYRNALKLDPDDPRIYRNLGNLELKRKRFMEAEQLLRKAIELDGNSSRAYADLGEVLKNQGRLAEAETVLRRAIAMNSRNAFAHRNLGVVLELQKRFPQAESAYRQAIKFDPDYKQTHNSLAILLQKLRRFPEAEAAYRQAIKLDPKFALAHFNLGLMHLLLKRHREAEKCCRAAIAADPTLPPAYGVLSITLANQGKFAEALQVAEAGLKLVPPNSPPAQIFKRDMAQIRAMMNRARKRGPVAAKRPRSSGG